LARECRAIVAPRAASEGVTMGAMDAQRDVAVHRLAPRPAWTVALPMLLALLGAAALMTWLVRSTAQQLLLREAEHTALTWAQIASTSVEDLELLLAEGRLTDAAGRDLLRLRRVQEVFRFKLFDREGRTVLVSDDLGRPAAVGRTKSGIGHDDDGHIRRRVLAGANHVETKRGSSPDRPSVYSEAYAPVRRDGRLLGIVEVYVDQSERSARIRNAFGLVSAALASMLILIGAGAAWTWLRAKARHAVQERMRYLAQHDVLSGLLNRASFEDELRAARWRHEGGGPGFAVLCVDLDHFKEINDTHGHATGDEVLRQVGERLRALVRQGDRVARLGGDEFAVLQAEAGSAATVERLAERIVASLSAPYEVVDKVLTCGATVGAALFGVDSKDLKELMHRADLAMYRAKAAGRGTFSFYDAELDSEHDRRHRFAAELRHAIGTDAISLHYQPLFAEAGRTLVGYEALLRWAHPTRGQVPPAEFIPLAEETGLIDALGRWVIRTACAEAASWPGDLSVAVNLSAAQFRRGDLVEVVARALDAAGLPAHRLQLEITESLLMSNTEGVLKALEQLVQMGVRIAMDDFGTGYSSLAYLWRFPFDKLKIDRAFTQHLEDDRRVEVIVKSIVSLAHSLGIDVNVEGVETPHQLDRLCRSGCDEMQGFLLGRPQPIGQLFHQNAQAPTAPPAAAVATPAAAVAPAPG
jgi:diguanylate cyclase (GGDEF)-like protein